MLQLYDSFSREKREFKPLNPSKVSIYVCGITPNNATHLGHAFNYVAFDVLFRLLKHKGYAVTYVQNATDINDGDDVIKQARDEGITWQEIARRWIDHFHTQMRALNVLPTTHYVLATSVIDEIIAINQSLIQSGNAYEKNGNVYFDISTFSSYGELSRYSEAQMSMISRERGNDPDDPNKRNPLDFVLWIHADEEPNWPSPWGNGRPGWHIECTAMSKKYLGDRIDIHGGGRDLLYPHHESERAQTECATGIDPFVQTWMHIGMVMFEGEKMSKSLGNLVLVQDLLERYDAHVIRWLLLSHHYRHPWEFEESELKDLVPVYSQIRARLQEPAKGDLQVIERWLDDDLNTPEVLRYLISDCSGETLKSALNLLGFTLEN